MPTDPEDPKPISREDDSSSSEAPPPPAQPRTWRDRQRSIDALAQVLGVRPYIDDKDRDSFPEEP